MDILDDQGIRLWGGLECTRNRVGDDFHDQFERSGHWARVDDLNRIADLGIKVVRYPALWEWASPAASEHYEWGWIDERFQRLKQLNIAPIAGLVHHGGGPHGVDLLKDSFAKGLEAYAFAFASRYPWVTGYTPVNEPLTTARFSALYGHWYPHQRDSRAFAMAMLNQCQATVLAMRAIRKVNPEARLIQTEDLGKTFASPSLQYQADFDNQRRWLTFDLLAGAVDRHHPIGSYFEWLGVPEESLRWFADNPLPADILGINYYVTSERYLDRRYHRYPVGCRGSNGKHVYADIEAVRVRREGLVGVKKLVQEAWKRYRTPIAITEAHIGCTREEQLRWLNEVWNHAHDARQEHGVDLRAVTAWALLGSFDWNSLLTRKAGYYESGAFDVRGPVPRPTAVAKLAKELASGTKPSHAVLAGDGWWRRDIRFLIRSPQTSPHRQPIKGPPILLISNGDTLGNSIKVCCEIRGLPVKAISRSKHDFSNPRNIDNMLLRTKPWAIIYTGQSREDTFLKYRTRASDPRSLNEPGALATISRAANLPLMAFSSSSVFGVEREQPYRESDTPNPICEFGRTKLQTELRILDTAPHALLVRPGAYLDISAKNGFLRRSVQAFNDGIPCCLDPITMSLTYLPEIVNTGLDLLIDGNSGIWHLAGEGFATLEEVAAELASRLRLEQPRVSVRKPTPSTRQAPSAYRAIASERGITLSPWRVAISRYLHDSHML
ncbi:family 1 glycosylhydrolase [Schlesneria sp. DSM 10557]|uniref:family 1 glycosylhydrolase n=1 Tax=Schlesneria sp. DSM 10557 TaxID=3044399 RepID=UPI00359FCBFD